MRMTRNRAGTHMAAVGMIRDYGEDCPPSALRVPDELHLRVEAIEDSEVIAVGRRTL